MPKRECAVESGSFRPCPELQPIAGFTRRSAGRVAGRFAGRLTPSSHYWTAESEGASSPFHSGGSLLVGSHAEFQIGGGVPDALPTESRHAPSPGISRIPIVTHAFINPNPPKPCSVAVARRLWQAPVPV